MISYWISSSSLIFRDLWISCFFNSSKYFPSDWVVVFCFDLVSTFALGIEDFTLSGLYDISLYLVVPFLDLLEFYILLADYPDLITLDFSLLGTRSSSLSPSLYDYYWLARSFILFFFSSILLAFLILSIASLSSSNSLSCYLN